MKPPGDVSMAEEFPVGQKKGWQVTIFFPFSFSYSFFPSFSCFFLEFQKGKRPKKKGGLTHRVDLRKSFPSTTKLGSAVEKSPLFRSLHLSYMFRDPLNAKKNIISQKVTKQNTLKRMCSIILLMVLSAGCLFGDWKSTFITSASKHHGATSLKKSAAKLLNPSTINLPANCNVMEHLIFIPTFRWRDDPPDPRQGTIDFSVDLPGDVHPQPGEVWSSVPKLEVGKIEHVFSFEKHFERWKATNKTLPRKKNICKNKEAKKNAFWTATKTLSQYPQPSTVTNTPRCRQASRTSTMSGSEAEAHGEASWLTRLVPVIGSNLHEMFFHFLLRMVVLECFVFSLEWPFFCGMVVLNVFLFGTVFLMVFVWFCFEWCFCLLLVFNGVTLFWCLQHVWKVCCLV